MRNANLDDAQRLFIHAAMFRDGIVPMEDPSMDVRRALANMPPDEARAARRKFRKLWRKLVKKEANEAKSTTKKKAIMAMYMPTAEKKPAPKPSNSKDDVSVSVVCAEGQEQKPASAESVPKRSHKNNRKRLVFQHVMKTEVAPRVKQFKSLKAIATATGDSEHKEGDER